MQPGDGKLEDGTGGSGCEWHLLSLSRFNRHQENLRALVLWGRGALQLCGAPPEADPPTWRDAGVLFSLAPLQPTVRPHLRGGMAQGCLSRFVFRIGLTQVGISPAVGTNAIAVTPSHALCDLRELRPPARLPFQAHMYLKL